MDACAGKLRQLSCVLQTAHGATLTNAAAAWWHAVRSTHLLHTHSKQFNAFCYVSIFNTYLLKRHTSSLLLVDRRAYTISSKRWQNTLEVPTNIVSQSSLERQYMMNVLFKLWVHTILVSISFLFIKENYIMYTTKFVKCFLLLDLRRVMVESV